MPNYFTPDLTGTLDDYKVTQDAYVAFFTGQVIEIEAAPVFLSSIVVTMLNNPEVVLVNGVDWEAQATDHDNTAMAKARLSDSEFAETLVQSITILKDLSGGPISINLSYQKLYPVASKASVGPDGGIDLTPALVADILARLSATELLLGGSSDVIIPGEVTPTLLAYDPNGINTDNVVTGETHTVNTFNHLVLIRPIHGSFFRDSVTVQITDTEEVLVEGVDYQIKGLDAAHTAKTLNTSGVYQLIHFIREFAGSVTIGYHAIGGQVTIESMESLFAAVNNVSNYLGSRAFLTTDLLAQSQPYLSIVNRMTRLENQVRSLATVGQATYADATNGLSVVKQLTAANTQRHWFTLAKLYQVEGAADVFVADRGKFRIHLVNAGLMADIAVAVNLEAAHADNILQVTADNVIQNIGYELFGAADVPSSIVMPEFRVIWNDVGGSPLSGALLQIGLVLPSLTETLAIEDYSGVESAWIMASGGATVAADDSVALPDTASTWTEVGVDSYSAVQMMPSQRPYRAWEGSQVVSGLDHSVPLVTVLPDHFRLQDVKETTLVLEDVGPGVKYSLKVPMVKVSEDKVTGIVNMQGIEGAGATDGILVTIERVLGVPQLSVGPIEGNAFDAVQYTEHTLQYVLVKV